MSRNGVCHGGKHGHGEVEHGCSMVEHAAGNPFSFFLFFFNFK